MSPRQGRGASPQARASSAADAFLDELAAREANASSKDRPRHAGKTRKPKVLSTESELGDAALNYLDRYDASESALKKVLLRKLKAQGPESPLTTEDVDRLVERLKGSQVVDDKRYAANLTSSLRGRGASSLKIASKLKARGVKEADAEEARRDDPVSELEAARTYARKRRLTKRFNLTDPQARQKALATLARQGFSFEIAQRALRDESSNAGETASEGAFGPDD